MGELKENALTAGAIVVGATGLIILLAYIALKSVLQCARVK
jgi:hypothetical protein